MGTWGAGAFENDDASDWAIELAEFDDLTLLHSALAVASATHLEATKGEVAVAAAEVVASALGLPGPRLPEEVEAWLGNHDSLIDNDEAEAALAAVKRVRGADSELAALWDEADDPEWADTMADLADRLGKLADL